MKKVLTFLCAVIIAIVFVAPVYAQEKPSGTTESQTTTEKKETTVKKKAPKKKAKKAKKAKKPTETTTTTTTTKEAPGGSTTERNVADAMAAAGAKYTPVVFETADQAYAAYDAGRCQAEANDKSAHAARRTLLKNPAEHVILDATFSKEPLGPAVRRGDDQWFLIVSWVVNVTFAGEELSVNQANVDQMKNTSTNPEIRRMLGVEGEMGKLLGLDTAWGYNVIKHVGNYKDIYDRHLGEGTKIDLPRGLNKNWKDGGLLYSPPIR